MSDFAEYGNGGVLPPKSTTTSRPRRQKSKHACESCKLRKRKCDGNQPCYMCERYEYDCHYAAQSRRKYSRPDERVEPERNGSLEIERLQPKSPSSVSVIAEPQAESLPFLEANSTLRFAQVVRSRLNPNERPSGLHDYAWNLGLRLEPEDHGRSIANIINKQEMRQLADVFFEKVHPIYRFIERGTIEEQVEETWSYGVKLSQDALLCGVAALGSLFSGGNHCKMEADIVQNAKETLEMTSFMRSPTTDHVAAWILRTLYLRMAVGPHAAWMSSCITIHLVEATGLHRNASSIPSKTSKNTAVSQNSTLGALEQRARLYWIARLLNTWSAHEYGRLRLNLSEYSCPLPAQQSNDDLTPSLLSIFTLSERYCSPFTSESTAELTKCLGELGELSLAHDALLLHQGNNSLCIYRRLRIVTPQIPRETLSSIIRLGNIGVQAAKRMAVAHQPWWHVVNVPFQFVCVLLAMDTRESLSYVSETMSVLRLIAQQFGTVKVQSALSTAELLVEMCRKNKAEERDIVSNALRAGHVANGVTGSPVSGGGQEMFQNALGGLDPVIDIDFDSFEWEQLWNSDFLMS
jgi:hypothetical protein